MENREVLIKTQNLKKYFPVKSFLSGQKKFLKAVDDVSIEIYKGETFGLVGESGCGKSTLGRTLIRMYDVTDGKIFYKDRDISKAGHREMKDIKNKMQIIFQDPYTALNPFWNVEEILSEPLQQLGVPKKQWRDRIEEMLLKVGLTAADMEKFPYEFSGGQRQRIGIARALSVNPEFVMCDEPISALDVSIQAQIVNMLEDLQNELGLTYLFAAHDLSMVKYISDRIGVMYLGKMVEVCESDELYRKPLHPYTRVLLSSVPIADPKKGRETKIIRPIGEVPNPMNVPEGCAFSPRCRFACDICKKTRPVLEEAEKGHFVACHRWREKEIFDADFK